MNRNPSPSTSSGAPPWWALLLLALVVVVVFAAWRFDSVPAAMQALDGQLGQFGIELPFLRADADQSQPKRANGSSSETTTTASGSPGSSDVADASGAGAAHGAETGASSSAGQGGGLAAMPTDSASTALQPTAADATGRIAANNLTDASAASSSAPLSPSDERDALFGSEQDRLPDQPLAGPPPGFDGDASTGEGPVHPLPAGANREGDVGLAGLADPDEAIFESLSGLASRQNLARYVHMGDFARRLVITVDNLPRERIPAQYSSVSRIAGPLALRKDADRVFLDPANSGRYDRFIDFAAGMGAANLVRIYAKFYPLLQKEYRAMGYAKRHFNDRVLAAIDDTLAAPVVDGPIELVQPKVHWRFADTRLESLSAGRKLMIRVGPRNAERLKKLLREIRAEILR